MHLNNPEHIFLDTSLFLLLSSCGSWGLWPWVSTTIKCFEQFSRPWRPSALKERQPMSTCVSRVVAGCSFNAWWYFVQALGYGASSASFQMTTLGCWFSIMWCIFMKRVVIRLLGPGTHIQIPNQPTTNSEAWRCFAATVCFFFEDVQATSVCTEVSALWNSPGLEGNAWCGTSVGQSVSRWNMWWGVPGWFVRQVRAGGHLQTRAKGT